MDIKKAIEILREHNEWRLKWSKAQTTSFVAKSGYPEKLEKDAERNAMHIVPGMGKAEDVDIPLILMFRLIILNY